MKLSKILLLLGVTACSSLAFAQPNNNALPDATNPNERVRFVRVNNVPASAMAWWLDPANNPMPTVFLKNPNRQQPYDRERVSIQGKVGSPVAASALKSRYQKGLERFPGVEAVIGFDAQRGVLVKGSAEGFAKVQTEVAKLDLAPQEVSVF